MTAPDAPAIAPVGDLLQRAVEEAARLLHADGAMIYLLDEPSGVLRLSHEAGIDDPYRQRWVRRLELPLGAGMFGVAALERRVVVSNDYERDESFTHASEADRFVSDVGLRSMVTAPLVAGDRVFGALGTFATRPDAFGEAEVALVRSLADHAAAAMANALLIDELAAHRVELEESRAALARRAEAEKTLREIAGRITAIREPAEVLRHVIHEARRLVRADHGVLDLLDADLGVLRWSFDTGLRDRFEPDEVEQLWIPVGVGATGVAVAEDRVVVAGENARDEFPTSPINHRFFEVTGFESMIVAPISSESGPLGAIEVYSTRRFAFDEADASVIRSLADQAAVAIQNARLIEELARSHEEIARRADRERTLRQIATNMTAIRDADVILQQTVDEARRLLRGSDVRIDLVEGDRMRWAFTSARLAVASREDLDRYSQLGEGVAGKAIAERRLVRIADYLTDDSFVHTEASDQYVRETGLRSVLAVPLRADGAPLGAISTASVQPDAFDDADAELLEALADHAAIAIQNARLIEELEESQVALAHRADTERSLREMAARIAELRDPAELLDRIVDESRRLLGSDGAHLTRLLEEGTHVAPVVVAGAMDAATEKLLKSMRFPLNAGINGLAAGRGEPVWTEDYREDPRIPREPDDLDTAERLGLRGMAAVPLRAPEGGIIGTLAVSFRDPHRFDDDEIGLLQGLADHAAIALTNTTLYERLRESEAAYRHLVQNSPDLVWSIDAEARFSFLSDTCERLTGWKPEELLGRHFGSIVHESSREVAEIDWTAGMTMPQQELRGRLNLRHRDGHPIPAEFIAMGTLDAEGRFSGANGSVRDMTERDRLERELRASKERYRHLLQSSPDLIWAADGDGRYTFVSDRSIELLGRRPDEVVGHHFAEFISPATLDTALAGYQALLANPTSIQRLHFALVDAAGRAIPYEVTAIGTADAEGRLATVNGVARDVSERDRLERELRDSEARFRQLVQTTPDVIWRADADGVFTFMAEGAEAMYGWPASEIVGHHFGFLTSPETMAFAEENYAALATEPDVVRHVPLTLVRRDGSTFTAEITAVGLFEEGRFVGAQGTVRDVSERQRLERELRESEERYRFLVDNSPDIVFSTDAEGRYTYYSDMLERRTGWRPDELLGHHFSKVVAMETFPQAGEAWARFVAEPSRMQVNRFAFRTRDGGLMPVEVSAIGMRDSEGRFAGIQGAARDISERERLERELRDSEARYRFLIEGSPDVIFSADAEGLFTYVSETIERVTGHRAIELHGKHFSVIVDPGSMGEASARWALLAADPLTPQTVQLNLVRTDGSAVPVEVSSIGTVDDRGRFAGITGSTRDMTERLGLERDLRRQAAELAAGEERAHLARELHDSVTQALFSMTLLTRTIEILLDRDAAAARSQLGALRDLQREALAEMRALIFELRPGNLEQDGLIHALRTHSAALQARIGLPIVVKGHGLPDRLPIEIEEVLYRIAQEALHNVVKHAAARQVSLELERDAEAVRLRIIDDGRGFDPAAVADGHLGLAGMRARAEKIGARVGVRSRMGAGTTIEIVVPSAAIPARDGSVATRPTPVPEGEAISAE